MINDWIDIFMSRINPFNSFRHVRYRSVTSIFIHSIYWIDVSPILADLVPIIYNYDYIQSIDSKVRSIHLPDRACNEFDYTAFNFSRFTLLEELIVGSDSFMSVNVFLIDGLNELKSVKIGINSFTKNKNSYDNNNSRSFSILNCNELESIEIGRYSFSDYGGGFELRNLPKLSTIKMDSYNFCYSSFVIKGIIDMILLMNRSSTFEFDYIRKLCIQSFLINSDIKYLNDLNE